MTPDDDGDDAAGPRTHGRSADREIPIGVPESPAEFDERKRAAERPGPPDSGSGDAQIDHGDDGGARS